MWQPGFPELEVACQLSLHLQVLGLTGIFERFLFDIVSYIKKQNVLSTSLPRADWPSPALVCLEDLSG